MEKTYKIVIDTKGSDKGQEMMVRGAVMALEKHSSLAVCLVGDADVIENECTKLGADMSRIEIIDAPEEINNFDSPATALFEKQK